MSCLCDKIAGLLDHVKRHIGRTGDVDDNAACTVNGCFKQRTCDCFLGGLNSAVCASAAADAHVSAACVLHNALDVRKVKVDIAGNLNGIGNALNALPENLVSLAESVLHAQRFIAEKLEPFVRDNNKAVNVLLKLADTVLSLLHTSSALKFERLCYNADRESAELPCNLGNNGSSARSGAAAHACGDENHIG